jgi:sulfite exporter TauE/SafE
MEAVMKAVAIIVLALALEAGFLMQAALPGPGRSFAGAARMQSGAEPHAQPLAVHGGVLGGAVPCTP